MREGYTYVPVCLFHICHYLSEMVMLVQPVHNMFTSTVLSRYRNSLLERKYDYKMASENALSYKIMLKISLCTSMLAWKMCRNKWVQLCQCMHIDKLYMLMFLLCPLFHAGRIEMKMLLKHSFAQRSFHYHFSLFCEQGISYFT